ncbi:MAG: hypothetical protein AAGI15_13060, partial [Pseudomonadota bacterium]
MRLVAVVLVGLLATLGTEFAVGLLLAKAPGDWPMIERYWLLTALPAVALVVLLCALLLWLPFRSGAARYPILFTLAYLAGLTLELSYFKNPPETIAAYLGIALAVCTVLLGGLW